MGHGPFEYCNLWEFGEFVRRISEAGGTYVAIFLEKDNPELHQVEVLLEEIEKAEWRSA